MCRIGRTPAFAGPAVLGGQITGIEQRRPVRGLIDDVRMGCGGLSHSIGISDRVASCIGERDVTFDRAERYAELISDLLLLQPVEPAQQKCRPCLLWQSVDDAHDGIKHLHGFGDPLRRQQVDAVTANRTGVDHCRFDGSPPDIIYKQAPGDRGEIGARILHGLSRLVFDDPTESILNQVCRMMGAACPPE